MDLVQENLVERQSILSTGPPPPPKGAPGGYPAPRKRVSAFKAQHKSKINSLSNGNSNSNSTVKHDSGFRSNDLVESAAATTRFPTTAPDADACDSGVPRQDPAALRRQIDEENKARIGSMSEDKIARARAELLSTLPPALVERLMKRVNLDYDENEQQQDFDRIGPPRPDVPRSQAPEIRIDDVDADANPSGATTAQACDLSEQPQQDATRRQPNVRQMTEQMEMAEAHELENQAKDVAATRPEENKETTTRPPGEALNIDDIAPPNPVDVQLDLRQARFMRPADSAPTTAPDPNDPNFLEEMQRKFFPTLSANPSQLAWMTPLPTENSPADRESPYYPGQDSLPVSALRFDFRGRLLGPKTARKIPVTKGLHHHGEAPEAAGYTIGELAIYARSAVPGQRCIAYQTLGRILYRLGKGDWGNGPMANGIWSGCLEHRVLDSLEEEVCKTNSHLSAQAYATEALWLYEKGGWKARIKVA